MEDKIKIKPDKFEEKLDDYGIPRLVPVFKGKDSESRAHEFSISQFNDIYLYVSNNISSSPDEKEYQSLEKNIMKNFPDLYKTYMIIIKSMVQTADFDERVMRKFFTYYFEESKKFTGQIDAFVSQTEYHIMMIKFRNPKFSAVTIRTIRSKMRTEVEKRYKNYELAVEASKDEIKKAADEKLAKGRDELYEFFKKNTIK